MSCRLLYGPSYASLQEKGFTRAAESDSENPTSILWLEQNDHRTDQVADAWADDHDPLRLEVTNLDQLVGECYESLTGLQSILDALTRRRLVDEALRELDEQGVLDDAHRHRGEVMDLFTALEDEGYDSSESVQTLVADSDLPDRSATVLERAYARFTDNRARTATDGEYTQSEAYQGVHEADEPFTDLTASHDVIVLSGYYDLSANERAVIEQLAESHPLVALLPTVDTPNEYDGANAAATDALAFYRDLADETRYVTPEFPSPLAEAAGNLYTPNTTTNHELDAETLRWVEAPTPECSQTSEPPIFVRASSVRRAARLQSEQPTTRCSMPRRWMPSTLPRTASRTARRRSRST